MSHIKIGGNTDITIHSENIEDYETGRKTGGVALRIEGSGMIVKHIGDIDTVTIWLSRQECQLLRKLIREKE